MILKSVRLKTLQKQCRGLAAQDFCWFNNKNWITKVTEISYFYCKLSFRTTTLIREYEAISEVVNLGHFKSNRCYLCMYRQFNVSSGWDREIKFWGTVKVDAKTSKNPQTTILNSVLSDTQGLFQHDLKEDPRTTVFAVWWSFML